jgi:hypothetical protein
VTINGTAHLIAAGAGTVRGKLQLLANAIEAGAVASIVRATLMDAEDTLQIFAEPNGTQVPTALNISVLAAAGAGTITIDDLGAIGYLEAEETGPKAAPENTLIDIIDTVVGWTSTVNLAAAHTGRDIETDAALRLRREQELHVANGGPVEAIRSALLDLDDVDEAIVLQNVTDLLDTVNGLPPHSVAAIVDIVDTPANDQLIAETLFGSVAGGIATYGSDNYTLRDSQDIEHVISFSRPTDIGILMRVTYHVYDEEVFPDDGQTQIQTIVSEWATNYQFIGTDMIPTRYIGPIYAGVSGIDQLLIEIDYKAAPAGWIALPIPISWVQRATLLAADVTFVVI